MKKLSILLIVLLFACKKNTTTTNTTQPPPPVVNTYQWSTLVILQGEYSYTVNDPSNTRYIIEGTIFPNPDGSITDSYENYYDCIMCGADQVPCPCNHVTSMTYKNGNYKFDYKRLEVKVDAKFKYLYGMMQVNSYTPYLKSIVCTKMDSNDVPTNIKIYFTHQ